MLIKRGVKAEYIGLTKDPDAVNDTSENIKESAEKLDKTNADLDFDDEKASKK